MEGFVKNLRGLFLCLSLLSFSLTAIGEVSGIPKDLLSTFSVEIEDPEAGDTFPIHTAFTSLGDDETKFLNQWGDFLGKQYHQAVPIFTQHAYLDQALALQSRLLKKGIESNIVELPDGIEQKIIEHGLAAANASNDKEIQNAGFIQRTKDYLKQGYEKPTKPEIAVGITSGVIRAGLASALWFTVGINPAIAAGLVIAQAALSTLSSVFIRTFDNWFAGRRPGIKNHNSSAPTPGHENHIGPRSPVHGSPRTHLDAKTTIKENERREVETKEKESSKRSGFWKEFGKRQAYSLSWGELWRFISGPTRSAHSVTSVLGQGEIFSNVLASGGASALLAHVRTH